MLRENPYVKVLLLTVPLCCYVVSVKHFNSVWSITLSNSIYFYIHHKHRMRQSLRCLYCLAAARTVEEATDASSSAESRARVHTWPFRSNAITSVTHP